MRRVVRFWGSALGATLAVSVAAARLFPYGALHLEPGPARFRVWLLTVWTAGMLAVCFGVAGLLGTAAPLGVREVVEAGSIGKAVEARRAARGAGGSFHGNFAWWLVATGGMLIAVYFIAWTARG